MEDAAYLERSFPELALHRGDLGSAILSCGLLVLDYPGTTLNLALAGNVPTVCFWAPGIWPAAEEAAPFFDALAEAGILSVATPFKIIIRHRAPEGHEVEC